MLRSRNYFYLVCHVIPESDPLPGPWYEAVKLDSYENLVYYIKQDRTITSMIPCPTFKAAKLWAELNNKRRSD